MKRIFSKAGEDGWNIAVRGACAGTILNDRKTPFQILPNTWRSWEADPFVFEHEGTTYIFAEVFDYLKRRGRIGYTCYQNGKWIRWKIVIDEPFHMSYPNVFRRNGEIYMIPETSEDRTLRLYKAVSFPNQWVLERILAEDVVFVDTTFIGDSLRAITTDISDEEHHRDWLLTFDDALHMVSREEIKEKHTEVSRCAGNFLHHDGKMIRVSQNCSGHYGNALVFSDFCEDQTDYKLGQIIVQLKPEDVAVSQRRRWTGVHTYNKSNQYEVIDINRNHYTVVSIWGRVCDKVARLLRRK